MTETIEKREDDVIWEDYSNDAATLVRDLQYALTLAKSVSKKMRDHADMDVDLFRDLERKVYAAYRTVGTMSALIDEADLTCCRNRRYAKPEGI